MKGSVHVVFGAIATVVVIATVVQGFRIVGPPDTRRMERLDARRLEDLQRIHAEIQDLVRDPDDSHRLRQPLPPTLDDVAAMARRRKLVLTDPGTGEPYGYAVTTDTTYELTATFVLARSADRDVFWNHPAGRHTFTIDALDPP